MRNQARTSSSSKAPNNLLKYFKYDLGNEHPKSNAPNSTLDKVNLFIPWDNASLARALSNDRMLDWLRDHGKNFNTEGIDKFGDELDEDDDEGRSEDEDDEKDPEVAARERKRMKIVEWLRKHQKSTTEGHEVVVDISNEENDDQETTSKGVLRQKLLDWLKTHKKSEVDDPEEEDVGTETSSDSPSSVSKSSGYYCPASFVLLFFN